MPTPANLVHETSTSTGTGNVTVAAVNGKRRFSTAFGTGATPDVFDYFISNRDAAEWERGTGHMSATGTLVRDTVIESTNANSAVNFSAGTKDVSNDVPAGTQLRAEAQTLSSGLQDQVRDNVSAFGVIRKQVFTASGTYTPHADMLYCIIECVGGGGGGGGVSVNSAYLLTAGGGGGGAYARKYASASDIGASQTVTIGAGGTGGSIGDHPGNSGGDTSVGALCIAKGGGGGNGSHTSHASSGGSGGSAAGSTGDVKASGNSGGSGTYFNIVGALILPGGWGGNSIFGAGAVAVTYSAANSATNGVAGALYGGGGGGAVSNQQGSIDYAGGNGAAGVVIVTEFCAK